MIRIQSLSCSRIRPARCGVYAVMMTALWAAAFALWPEAAFAQTFSITEHEPITNAVGVDVSAEITATFDADLESSTVTTTTFVAHGSFSGFLTGTLTVDGDDLSFDPARSFFAGEQVQVVAASAISSSGGDTLNPLQWGFTAGPIVESDPRCLYFAENAAADALAHVQSGWLEWGDYDNDGDLDILLAGSDSVTSDVTEVYRNDGGSFVAIGAALPGMNRGEAHWGDYDNDGDLDILLHGQTFESGNVGLSIYRNDNGTFTDIGAALPSVRYSTGDWADYDNDGDLDILIIAQGTAAVYRNDDGTFSDIGAADDALIPVLDGASAWGDYDGDGDLDILLMGDSGGEAPISVLYRNDSGVFVDANADLIDVYTGSVAWGDYDNDGDLDILLTGDSGSGDVSRVYRNDNGVFVDVNAGLIAVTFSSVAWGDYDRDGDLDILLAGSNVNSGNVSKVYRNDDGSFVDDPDIYAAVVGLHASATAWGDTDNDGDLDILMTGSREFGFDAPGSAFLYRNEECADLAITKTVTSTLAAPGDPITYSVAFTNTGSAIAANVILTDRLPVSVTVTGVTSNTLDGGALGGSLTLSQTAAGAQIVWNVSDLAVGEGGRITVTALVTDAQAILSTTFANTVEIAADNDSIVANNLAEAPVKVISRLSLPLVATKEE